jgi:hypothetical protein
MAVGISGTLVVRSTVVPTGVGPRDGAGLVALEGLEDGSELGISLGMSLGISLGISLGTLERLVDGAELDSGVGGGVGCLVGDSVGASVGASVGSGVKGVVGAGVTVDEQKQKNGIAPPLDMSTLSEIAFRLSSCKRICSKALSP